MKRRRGFSFVELLVVVSIISILSAVGMAVFTGSQKRARDARRLSDLGSVQSALELYRADNPATGYPNVAYAGLGTPLAGYLSALPTDPKTAANYTYSRTSPSAYTLSATCEVLAAAQCTLTPP